MQPLNRSGRNRTPWAPTSCPRLPHPSSPSPQIFASSGGGAISAMVKPSRPLHPHSPSRVQGFDVGHAALYVSYYRPRSRTASLGLLATPDLSGRTVPPGRLPLQHRDPTRAAVPSLSRELACVGFTESLRGLFRRRRGRLWGANALLTVSIEPRGTWTYM